MPSILDLDTTAIVNPTYYDPKFRRVLEDHLTSLASSSSNKIYTPAPGVCWKHRGDFYGLLEELNIPKELHYITMRMSGLRNHQLFTGEDITLIIPSLTEVERLLRIYSTNSGQI